MARSDEWVWDGNVMFDTHSWTGYEGRHWVYARLCASFPWQTHFSRVLCSTIMLADGLSRTLLLFLQIRSFQCIIQFSIVDGNIDRGRFLLLNTRVSIHQHSIVVKFEEVFKKKFKMLSFLGFRFTSELVNWIELKYGELNSPTP